MIWQKEIVLPPYRRGFHLITHLIEEMLPLEEIPFGVLHIFIKHTSAAIMVNESYDPSVRVDLENAFDRLAPENEPYYTHTLEGSDDMPAHIKTALIGTDITIPITNGRLNLGTWQGIYLCEFRNYGGRRKLVLTIVY